MKLTAHFDGGCRAKQNLAAGAAVLYDEGGHEIASRSHVMYDTTTPVAEYMGLILALELAREHGGTDVTILGDAELIVRHVDGRYRCRQEHLQPMLAYVRTLMSHIPHVEVREFPKAGPQMKRRFGNERADQLANEAMNSAPAG